MADRIEQGLPTPAWDERPELMVELQGVWAAFGELHTCRGGMGDGAIPWTAIDRYAERHGIEGDDFEEFLILVRAMDDEYREATRPKD